HDLQHKCRTLRLAETAKTLPNMLRQAESKNWTYYELLDQIFSYELECREEKNRAKLMKWAEFPQHLTLDQFKLAEQSAIGDKQLNVLKELSWIEDHFTLIMMGPPGVGKTHLSTGLGIHAVNQGYQDSSFNTFHCLNVLKEQSWIEDHFTLIMMGPPGVGKTHLSTGLGIHAVNQGYQVSFIPMDHLVYILKTR